MNAPHKPIVYIISAPSGSGKSTLVNKILKLVPDLDFSISYTTRQPRGAEQNGKQYHFVPREEFERMIRSDEFLEYASLFADAKNIGDYYGTAWRFLRQAEQHGHDLLLDIDVQGAKQIKQKLPQAVSVFILPPDRKTLERRLRGRSEDPEHVIQRRLGTATREIENYDRYDYILINDKLDESCEKLRAIVLAERLRRSERELSQEDKKIVALADYCRLANARERVQPILSSFSTPAASARP